MGEDFGIVGVRICNFNFFNSEDESFCEIGKGGVWVVIEGGGDRVLKILGGGVCVFLCRL